MKKKLPRPRITLFDSSFGSPVWKCVSSPGIAYALTPKAAYDKWLYNMQAYFAYGDEIEERVSVGKVTK